MDNAHLMVAARYVENNPVKARMVERAEDWPWSSALAHICGRPDALTDIGPLRQHIANWRAMLADGLEASDRIEGALKSGRPQGAADWIAQLEANSTRSFEPPKMGRPKKK